MRVLHVYGGALFGGIETMMVTIARHQVAYPSLLHEFALSGEGPLGDALGEAGAVVHRLPAVRASRPFSVWRARRALSELIHLHPFDRVICHAAWPYAVFGAAVPGCGVPLVAWVHDAPTGRHWTERWAGRTTPDLAVCNSQYTAGRVSRVWPGVVRRVVYCPSEMAPAQSTPADDRATVRAPLATPDAATVIVQAGRLEPYKGHAMLLEALATLADRPDWILWIVGGAQRAFERDYLASLHQTAERLGIAGRVRFTGYRSDISRLFRAADIQCQPNIAPEPFGLVFIDALAAGIPAVGSRSGGVIEIVDDSCGMLVPPGDVESLALALDRLIQDPIRRRALGAAGPARARHLCDPRTQLATLHDVLSTMGGQRDAA
jgi:glycosyltransferase involved in cell wall biosynthesis